jgi:hypothetical protein
LRQRQHQDFLNEDDELATPVAKVVEMKPKKDKEKINIPSEMLATPGC